MKKIVKQKLVSNFTLSFPYGRFGNNLQQISLGIMFANLYRKNFYVEGINNVENFKVVNNNFSHLLSRYRHDSKFYYFDPASEPYINNTNIDSPLKSINTQYYKDNMFETFQKYISPNITYKKNISIDEETLVIHVRSGDIFNLKSSKNYFLQNPLSYYLSLMDEYEKIIVVSEGTLNNPVIEYLSRYRKVKIVSNSYEEDFNLLRNAKNLATSGVGTFAIAAALSSEKINNLYYSNLYFNHHLNPKMMKGINHFEYSFENYYKIGKLWDNSKDNIEKMLSKEVFVKKLSV